MTGIEDEVEIAQATEEIDRVVARLQRLDKDEQRRVLRQLDPEMRAVLFERVRSRLAPTAQQAVDDVLRRKDENWRPVDDDDLWHWIVDEVGIKVPRKAVCPGHSSPFEAFCDAYWDRYRNIIWVGNRGSGKTKLAGVRAAVKCRTFPGWTGATIGARKDQSTKCFGYFSQIVTKDSWRRFLSKRRAMWGGTPFKNGSNYEVLTGTLEGVNSPHPNGAHWDEVEQLRPGVYEEGLNMSQSSTHRDPLTGKDVTYRASNLLTSSWKKARGFVTEKLQEAKEKAGSYKVHIWCMWETTKVCESDCSACPFAHTQNGWLDDEKTQPRTFEWACKRDSPFEDPETGAVLGKLKFTDGFVEIDDAVDRFLVLSRRMFEAQQESRRPTLDGIAYDWDEIRYDASGFEYDPDNGDLEAWIDPGTPSAFALVQVLNHDRRLPDGRVIPAGSWVAFREIYEEGLGAAELGVRINSLRLEVGEDRLVPLERTAMDAAALMARLDLQRLNRDQVTGQMREDPLYTPIRTIGRKGFTIANSIEWVRDELISVPVGSGDKKRHVCKLWIDVSSCPELADEIGQYEVDKNGVPLKDQADHHMDGLRYLVAVHHLRLQGDQSSAGVAVGHRERAVVGHGGEMRRVDRFPDMPEEEREFGTKSVFAVVPRIRRTP